MLAESAERLRDEGFRLQELQEWFALRNRRNGFVAGAFGLLAEVRVRQIEAGTVMRVDLKGLRKRIDSCLRDAYVDAGPLGEITARMDGTLALSPGAAIELGFAPEHLYRFDAEGQRI